MMASFTTFGASLPRERIQNALGVLQELTQTEDSGSFVELLSKSNGIDFRPVFRRAGLYSS